MLARCVGVIVVCGLLFGTMTDGHEVSQSNQAASSTSSRKEEKGLEAVVAREGTLMLPLESPLNDRSEWHKPRSAVFGEEKEGLSPKQNSFYLVAPRGTAVRACAGGSVLWARWYGGYGKVVIISHGEGCASLYAHLAKSLVTEGQQVRQGETIGTVGTTGFSSQPHLHFEMRVHGLPVPISL